MLRLKTLTIKQKLAAVTMIAITATIVPAIVAFAIWEQIDVRRTLIDSTQVYAAMLADNCGASLSFENKEDAEQILLTLRFQTSIVCACVYDKHGTVFAQYRSESMSEKLQPPKPRPDGYFFGPGGLSVFKQVVIDNEAIGFVYLLDDMRFAYSELRWTVYTAVLIMLLALAGGCLVSWKLQTMASAPILELARIATEVSEKKDYSIRASEKSKDEVGYLTHVFNTMLEQIQQRDSELSKAKDNLETRVRERTVELTCANEQLIREVTERKRAETELKKIQEKLIDAARRAGMAEVAADVLHNVGNVLNSINVSTTVITEKVKNSEVTNLEKIAILVNDHIDEIGTFLTRDPRGKHIPVYLNEVGKCLQAEQTDIIGKLQVLTDNVQHIKDIISMQQAYAKVSGVEVQVSLSRLVEDAIRINIAGLQRHGTRLVREFEELPEVEIDKQRVLQILVNLISNAKYALSDSKKREKLVTIRLYKHNKDRFRIEVSDNGVGIPEKNLTKIFSHGFTTKEGGHGFGLHGSALAAKELGGSLTVHSRGAEQGATFTLELPFKPVRVVS
jgi:signal transduction histidine kinase